MKLNIKQLKDDTNYVLYECFNCGLEELKFSNELFSTIEQVLEKYNKTE